MASLTLIAPASGETQLVPVYRGTIGGVPAHVCKASDLHSFLEVGRDFSTWFKERVEKYGFAEGQDFELIPQNGRTNKGDSIAPQNRGAKRGGHNRKDYLISLDMAKELSMVENNAKGREARRYFITMERKALEAMGQCVPACHLETLIPSEQQLMHEAVDAKAAPYPAELQTKVRREIWSRVHNKFRVSKYEQLPRTRLMEAILYVTQMELRGVPSTPTTPEPMPVEKISREQYQELSAAMVRAFSGWIFQGAQSSLQRGYNRLRVNHSIAHIADLPAEEFEQAMATVAYFDEACRVFQSGVSEAKDLFLDECIEAGAPWTQWLERKWKQQMRAKLPERPNWLEIQQQIQSAKTPSLETPHAE